MSSERVGAFPKHSKMIPSHGDYVLERRVGQPSDEGAVYHAKYQEILDCAIKFIEPTSVDKKTIESEVRLLSLLRHTHLVRIMDFGLGVPQPPTPSHASIFPQQTQQYFYIVMEYVPGQPIDDTWSTASATELLSLFDQLLSCIVYLHDRGVLHMDLKPKNILVEVDTGNLVIIDLGFSIVADRARFRDVLKLTEAQLATVLDSDEVYVASTNTYTHGARQHYLHQKLKRDELRRTWFPSHDLYAVGLIIEQAIEGRVSALSSTGVGLKLISTKLIQGRYSSAAAARSDLQKLQPFFLAPMGIPELSLVCDNGRSVSLSTETVHMTDRIRSLVSHRFLQRLRSIPQLELEYLVYPDARHSRLSHSLLVYDYCRQALTHLLRDPHFRVSIDTADIEGVLLFALLHDVGHYPLSHMFEDFRGHLIPMADEILGDDDLFPAFVSAKLSDPLVSLLDTKRGSQRSFPEIISSAFAPGTLDAMLSIARCASLEETPSNPIHCALAGLVSSAVDLDKIAYLSADSTMTGVPYGKGIDREAFFGSLTMPPGLMNTDDHRSGPVIAVTDKGLTAVESIIMARYWMLSRVYWHHTNRAIMAACKFVLSELIGGRHFTFADYLDRTFWFTEAEAVVYLVQLFDQHYGSAYVNPLHGLINGSRDIYKRLVTFASHEEQDLYTRLVENETAAPNVISVALKSFFSDGELRHGSIIVDVPRKRRDSLDLERIRIVTNDEGRQTIRDRGLDLSPVISQLKEEFLNEVKKCRVFIARKAFYDLESRGQLQKARDAVRRSLKTSLG